MIGKIYNSLNIRFILLNIISFFVMLSYGIVKSPIDSLFLQYQSAARLPIVWILMMLAAFIVMELLNQFSSRYSMLQVFKVVGIITALLLILICGLFYLSPSIGVYALVIWKEIYIVVLVEVFWSFANLLYSINTAKWSYGFMLACGSVGNILGNLSVATFATKVGSVNGLLFALPVFAIIIIIPALWYSLQKEDRVTMPPLNVTFGRAFSVVRASNYLTPLFLLVICSQVASTIIEYTLSFMLTNSFTDVDERTAVMSNIEAVINSLSMIVQVLAGMILKLVGVSHTLTGMPIMLGIILILSLFSPQFSIIVISRITSKVFDYSILRTTKEILYIPLSRLEITQGKSMIDIFAFRIARGLCSMLLIVLSFLGVGSRAIEAALLALVAWALLALIIAKRFRSAASLGLVHPKSTRS